MLGHPFKQIKEALGHSAHAAERQLAVMVAGEFAGREADKVSVGF